MAEQRHDPIDRAAEILQTHQESVEKATEILKASRTGEISAPVAEAVHGADGVRSVRRGWWPIDPLIVAVILMALAVGTLAVIVALQATATTDRAAANQEHLSKLSDNVSALATQLKALEKNDLAKDQLNVQLLEQDKKFRAYLKNHKVNPDKIAGPLPNIPRSLLGDGGTPTPPAVKRKGSASKSAYRPRSVSPKRAARPTAHAAPSKARKRSAAKASVILTVSPAYRSFAAGVIRSANYGERVGYNSGAGMNTGKGRSAHRKHAGKLRRVDIREEKARDAHRARRRQLDHQHR